jgi:hypothetical protein
MDDRFIALIVCAVCCVLIALTISDKLEDPIAQQIEKCRYACHSDMNYYDAEKKICECKKDN